MYSVAQWFGAYDDHDHKVNARVLGGAEWNFFLTTDKF